MAIRTTVKPKYAFRALLMVAACVVLGLWGVYDYVIAIPKQQREFDRGQVCSKVYQALDSAGTGGTQAGERLQEAREAVGAELEALVAKGVASSDTPPTPEQLGKAMQQAANDDPSGWPLAVAAFSAALNEAPKSGPRSSLFRRAYETAKHGVDATAELTAPSRFDRLTQWGFMLCLPCAPYLAWQLHKQRRRVIELDDDGTIRGEGETWTKDEIADIDMSRWMSRSVAFVVHEDGRRLKLDDYIWAHTDEIVGRMAAERYPNEWTADARPVKKESVERPAPETTDLPETSVEGSEPADKA